jgi:hypothetical protein
VPSTAKVADATLNQGSVRRWYDLVASKLRGEGLYFQAL